MGLNEDFLFPSVALDFKSIDLLTLNAKQAVSFRDEKVKVRF